MPKRSKKSIKTQQTTPTTPPTVSPMITPQQVMPQPTLSQETIQKLQQSVAELIVKGGELGMEIACSDCKAILNCPVVEKAKEIVKIVKEVREILREQVK